MGRVASLGCVVCRMLGNGYVPCQVHHIREGQGMSERAMHYLTIGLCPEHHTDGGPGVAIHADKQWFERLYGDELHLLGCVIAMLGKAFYR